MEDGARRVVHWIVNNQCARRNLTPEQQRYLLGRKYTAEKAVNTGAPKGNRNASKKQLPEKLGVVSRPFDTHKDSTAAKIGKAAGVSDWTVAHSEKYADAVDDLDARGVVSKSDILSGAVKIPASKVVDAAEIRIRAERRIGELMKAQKDAGLMAKGTKGQLKGRDPSGRLKQNPPEPAITLADVGIDKSLADRARKYAAVPDDGTTLTTPGGWDIIGSSKAFGHCDVKTICEIRIPASGSCVPPL